MSLREVIQRCVANNADVKVAGYQPAIDQTRVTEAEARFDPTFFTNITYSDQTTLAPSPTNVGINPGEAFIFRTWSTDIGVKQDLESGGNIQLKYTPARTQRNNPNNVPIGINPFFTSDLELQLTQPLLRDFGSEINYARIAVARNNQKISLLDFRDQLEKNISDIEKAYWQLVEAERDVEIADELLSRTIDTAQIIRNRIGQDVGRVQVSQATSSVEARAAVLIRARAHVRDLSDQIKRLMGDPDFPVSGGVLILPATMALEEQIRFNNNDQIQTAMENRLELGQQQLRIDNAYVAGRVAKNNIFPQLNLVGSVGVEGIGADWDNALRDQSNFDHISYSIGLQFEVPIGNRGARAIWKRSQLQRMQAIAQYDALIQQVSMEVQQAVREVGTTWEEMIATRNARFAAYDAMQAIEARSEAADAFSPTFIDLRLSTQERYADARQRESQAVANYNIAIAALEKAKGTLLRYNNITMEEAPLVRQ
jgi:outer membrane protein TolC